MARGTKRVKAKEREAESEKYAFRCFLLRLGMSGTEYKEDRKILLRNLEGPSAFPTQRAADEFAGRQKEKRDNAKAATGELSKDAEPEMAGTAGKTEESFEEA